ncbi:MAG: hypothetical protein ACFFG0_03225 [Candidatus Thorarchaeota archaeon]
MQKKINWLAVFAVVMTIISILSIYSAMKPSVLPEDYLPADQLQLKIDSAVADAIVAKDAEIADLNNKLVVQEEETIVEEKESRGYLIDEIIFGMFIDKIFSDREVETLLDTKVEFDSDKYEMEQTLNLSGLQVLTNEEDFNGVAHMVVPMEGLEYMVVFDSELNTSLINEEETLLFNFLGSPVEISEWNGDTLTFTQGNEILLSEGDTVVVGEHSVFLKIVLDEEVYVEVDGEGKSIDEGDSAVLNGLDVKVADVLYSGYSGGTALAELVVGEEVEKEVMSGDEYEGDSVWEWVIDTNSIGLVLVEEFTELDDELAPMAANGQLCLPNEYICVRYNGVLEETMEDYSLELDVRGDIEYVEVRGKFINGLEDYDRVFVNTTGIYDEDFELIGTSVILGDSDLTMDLVGTNIEINDVVMPLNLSSISVDGVDISGEEDDYMNVYGILIKAPEDSVEDQEFDLIIPEEHLESTITVL